MISVLDLAKIAEPYRVLYVEDSKKIQGRMLKYLQKLFASVAVADDGLAGVEVYKNGEFDLVITDLSMPKMNGIEMIKEIRKIDAEQSVLVTSAHGETDYMIGAINAGIDGYIIKPFDFKQLNYELYKIVSRLQKFQESALYKKSLENLIEKKSAVVSSLLLSQSENYEKTLYSMVRMIEDRDTYTAGHSTRVARYSQMIAKEMGYSEEECTKIYQAGMLHDIGKVATPDAVLLKPKSLNNLEYKLIQEHVNVSYNLLKNVPMFENLAEIVYSHHEKFDGSGYPRGLRGDEIHPLAQIMIVADAFDAMTTSRIYKARKNVTSALDEVESLSGKQFHPQVVQKVMFALQDIEIDEQINQLPRTDLEEKRFAYFYEDILTDVYNKNYLELLLAQNQYEKKYIYMETIFINDFSSYNKKTSWSSGDEFLKKFAKVLKDYFAEDLVFRVFGDDFVVLCKELKIMRNLDEVLQKAIEDTGLTYRHICIDLRETKIDDVEDIEHISA